MPGTAVIGLECKHYRNTGTVGTPTWNETVNARDVNFNFSREEADVSSRATSYVRTRGTRKVISIDWTMIWDHADTDMEAFRDACLNGTTIELAVSDGAIATAGNEYFRAICEIFEFNLAEPMSGERLLSIVAKPGYDDTTFPTYNTAV